jgi:predicted kinase
MTRQPVVYMLAGPSCSGKTTWRLKNHPKAVLIDTDSYIDAQAQKECSTYNEVFKKAFAVAEKDMRARLKDTIAARRNIVWDQTNLTRSTRQKKIQWFDGTDYYRVGVFFAPPDLKLLTERNKREGKIIPAHVMKIMVDTFEYPLPNETHKESYFNDFIWVSPVQADTYQRGDATRGAYHLQRDDEGRGIWATLKEFFRDE